MTEIERKALALLIEIDPELADWGPDDVEGLVSYEALCRAIEQHEAFKQEVSDAVEKLSAAMLSPYVDELLGRFIIPKPVDPLVEAWQMAFPGNHIEDARDECAKISAAIENCGGKIVWGEE